MNREINKLNRKKEKCVKQMALPSKGINRHWFKKSDTEAFSYVLIRIEDWNYVYSICFLQAFLFAVNELPHR